MHVYFLRLIIPSITQDKNNYIQLDPSLERFANAKSFGSSDFRQNRDPDVKEYSPKFDIFRCCTLF